ncbi:MAG: iron uptake protein [Burkholderiaceae bacterium]
MTTETYPSRHLQIAGRIAAAVLGGYAFCWGFIAVGITGLFALGMPFHDAEHLSSMLGMLVFLIVFLWAFAARGMVRVWLVLLGGGALMAGAATLLQSRLIA